MCDMTVDEVLSWCQFSCGKSVHNKCMRVWAEHKATTGDKVTCALCRQDWRPGQVRAVSDRSFGWSAAEVNKVFCGGCT